MEAMLEQAAKVLNEVEDPELQEMIHRLDYTPAPELVLDVNDYLRIYNWLKELELYRKLHGPIGGC